MPVDYTGLLIAIALWFGGTACAFRCIRGAKASRPEFPKGALTKLGVAIVWTGVVSVILMALGVFIIWFYDWLNGRA